MDLPARFLRAVLEARHGIIIDSVEDDIPSESELQKLLERIQSGVCTDFSMEVYLARKCCRNVEELFSVERWNFQIVDAATDSPTNKTFLHQALDSQLFFSVFNSWIQDRGGEAVRLLFRVKSQVPSSHFHQSHAFSCCPMASGSFLLLTHEFRAKAEYPQSLKCECNPAASTTPLPTFAVKPDEEDSTAPATVKRHSRSFSGARRPASAQRTRRHTTGDDSPRPATRGPASANSPSLKHQRLCGATRSRRLSSQSGLLGSFEESALHGRLKPAASIDGFHLRLTRSNLKSLELPIRACFFNVSDDNIPSLYMGHVDLAGNVKPIRVEKQGRLQAAVFNPEGRLVHIFLIDLNVGDMPACSSTFIRQRVEYANKRDPQGKPCLRHLIHIRLATDENRKVYIHTDIKLLFTNKSDADSLDLTTGSNELDTSTEMPTDPKYSLCTSNNTN